MDKHRCCRWASPSPHLIWWRWRHYPSAQRWSGTSLPLYTLAQTSFYSENKAKESRKLNGTTSLVRWTSEGPNAKMLINCDKNWLSKGPCLGSVNVCDTEAFLCKSDLTACRFRLAVLLRCREMTKFVSRSKYLWRWLDFYFLPAHLGHISSEGITKKSWEFTVWPLNSRDYSQGHDTLDSLKCKMTLSISAL